MKAGKRKVYVTKRWRWVAWLTQCLPEFIYNTRQWQTKAQRKAQKKTAALSSRNKFINNRAR